MYARLLYCTVRYFTTTVACGAKSNNLKGKHVVHTYHSHSYLPPTRTKADFALSFLSPSALLILQPANVHLALRCAILLSLQDPPSRGVGGRAEGESGAGGAPKGGRGGQPARPIQVRACLLACFHLFLHSFMQPISASNERMFRIHHMYKRTKKSLDQIPPHPHHQGEAGRAQGPLPPQGGRRTGRRGGADAGDQRETHAVRGKEHESLFERTLCSVN